jgi:bifunctional non-homologous end joining protein LigD
MSGDAIEIRAGRRSVRVTNADKVLFPGDGITKADLVEYYVAVARIMVPHVKNRPATMERYPDGLTGERIFQKQVPKYFPEWIATYEARKKGGSVRMPLVNDAATLAYLANQACVTPHVWLSRADRPGHPDQMMFDLDPSTDDFAAVRETALAVRELLAEVDLPAFVKTSGSRGLHVVVPLDRAASFEEAGSFAAGVASILVRRDPQRLTTEARKAERGGKIFLDIWRNAYAQMAAAPYSVRARRGAPVSMPLEWTEVDDTLLPDSFTIASATARVHERGDVWATMANARRSLRRAAAKLERLLA